MDANRIAAPTHHGHSHTHVLLGGRAAGRRALAITLVLTAGFTVVEIVAGLLTDSLALLADAGHMLSDSLSLGVALFAIWLAGRPATPRRTFGYQRAEILAALFNGATLVAIAIWIFIEASTRFDDPPDVLAGPMLAVASAGLLVNLLAARILHRTATASLNVAAALRHVLADVLGSAGAIAAALIILTTGWRYADPLVSILIGFLILASSWAILRDSTAILLEASPRGLEVEKVGKAMASLPGVIQVHDLHVWMITSGFPALAAHVIVGADDDCHAKRRELERLLATRFGLEHTTLQVDHERPRLIQIEPSPPQGGPAEKLTE